MTMKEYHDYLRKALGTYRNDPACTDFQRGYLAALVASAKVTGLERTAYSDLD